MTGYFYLVSVMLSVLLLSSCGDKPEATSLPERPPTFDELMVLADKNLAKNDLIKSYIYNEKDGVGFRNVMRFAQTGDTEAEVMACYLLILGIGIEEDKARGYPFCETAAAKGAAPAKANLIYRDLNDRPRSFNWQKAHNGFTALIDSDPSTAHGGLQYLHRKNHPKASTSKLYYHLDQGIKHDNTKAMQTLAEIDLRRRNFQRAEKNLKRAYDLYDFDAGFRLAALYRNGTVLDQNLPEYVSMINHMAAFLHPHSIAELGYMYSTGTGVEADQAKAKAFRIQAAKLGHPLSQGMVAQDLLFGPEEARDYEMGVRYFEKTAETGNVQAMVALANHYFRAEVDDPERKAVTWLSQAAMFGDSMAQERLGAGMMDTGYIEAMQPYIQALETAQKQGDPEASYLLARHYRAASGVKRDLAKARVILNKIKNSDDPRVGQELEMIELYISHFGSIEAVPDNIRQ